MVFIGRRFTLKSSGKVLLCLLAAFVLTVFVAERQANAVGITWTADFNELFTARNFNKVMSVFEDTDPAHFWKPAYQLWQEMLGSYSGKVDLVKTTESQDDQMNALESRIFQGEIKSLLRKHSEIPFLRYNQWDAMAVFAVLGAELERLDFIARVNPRIVPRLAQDAMDVKAYDYLLAIFVGMRMGFFRAPIKISNRIIEYTRKCWEENLADSMSTAYVRREKELPFFVALFEFIGGFRLSFNSFATLLERRAHAQGVPLTPPQVGQIIDYHRRTIGPIRGLGFSQLQAAVVVPWLALPEMPMHLSDRDYKRYPISDLNRLVAIRARWDHLYLREFARRLRDQVRDDRSNPRKTRTYLEDYLGEQNVLRRVDPLEVRSYSFGESELPSAPEKHRVALDRLCRELLSASW